MNPGVLSSKKYSRLRIVAVVLAAAAACARETPAPAPKEFEVGARRVQITLPTGWEALDQGKQKRFRKGELEIVLQNLGPATPPPRDPEALIDWGLASVDAGVGHDQRREVRFRRTVTVDGREMVDIETWNRLDHTNPQRILFVPDDGELLALQTVGMASADSLAAFEAIRNSLHFRLRETLASLAATADHRILGGGGRGAPAGIDCGLGRRRREILRADSHASRPPIRRPETSHPVRFLQHRPPVTYDTTHPARLRHSVVVALYRHERVRADAVGRLQFGVSNSQ